MTIQNQVEPPTRWNLVWERGQTLVEAVVALGIVLMVITALVVITTTALNRSKLVEERLQAQKYSQEGIEWIRAEKDNNDWADFLGRLGPPWGIPKTYCFNVSPIPAAWPAEGGCGDYDLADIFMREAALNVVEPNDNCQSGPNSKCIEVKMTVSWQEGGRTHTSEQTTYLTDWER